MEDKVIDFQALRAGTYKPQNQPNPDQQDRGNDTLCGTLVWLHCPECNTFEYTAQLAPNGRRHKCGTMVLECVCELNLRAEATLVAYNIALLQHQYTQVKARAQGAKHHKQFLELLQATERTYFQKLFEAAVGRDLEVYEMENADEIQALIPQTIKQEPLGMLISPFRQSPEKRFE